MSVGTKRTKSIHEGFIENRNSYVVSGEFLVTDCFTVVSVWGAREEAWVVARRGLKMWMAHQLVRRSAAGQVFAEFKYLLQPP